MQADFELFAQHMEVLRTDDYLVGFDEYRRSTDDAQLILAHIRVFRWAPSVFKRMRREWALFRTVCHADIYAMPPDDTPIWRRFVEALGFTYFKPIICNDGLSRPLYISRVTDVAVDTILHIVEPAGVCPAGR